MSWKIVIKNFLNSFGYDLHKVASGGIYTPCYPYNYSTYSPWFEKTFQKIYGEVSKHTVVTEDRCYLIYKFVKHCLHLPGDLAECGVYLGGTAYLIANTLERSTIRNKAVHLFDTFSGMPSSARKKRDGHRQGDFGQVNLTEVKKYLSKYRFLKYHKGLIPLTFNEVVDKIFCFVHIDVDIYPTTKDCCNFFYKRMVSGGIMLFDDYGFPNYINSEKKAVDDFFRNKTEVIIPLRSGQCLVIKQ